MLQAKGDVWTFSPPEAEDHPAQVARVVTTNGYVKKTRDGTVIGCVMGKGIAEQARDRFPGLDYSLGCYIVEYGNRVFDLGQITSGPGMGSHIVSYPVKHYWWLRADFELIRRSAVQLVALADKRLWRVVILPRPGCGNGQLEWHDVEPVIAPLLDDRFTVLEYEAE